MEPAERTDPAPRHGRRVPAGTTWRRPRGPAPAALVALLVTAVLLTACGAAERLQGTEDHGPVPTDDAAEAPAQDPSPGTGMTADAVEEEEHSRAAEGDPGTTDGDVAPRDAQTDGRAVVRTARMHVRARDTATTADRIVALVEDSGGYVSGTDLRRDADGVVSGRLTLRVPTEELTPTLDAIDELVDSVLERRLDEEDVTTQLSDLDARIANLEAYEEELRALLTEVREADGDTEDLLQVFERVNEVRSEIDQATARRTVLRDQVALSTIQLELSPTPATGPLADPAWAPGDTARGALATTMRILTEVADAVIRIVLTVLPVLVVVLAPLALIVWVVRRIVLGRRADSPADLDDAPDPDLRAGRDGPEPPSPGHT